MDPKALASLDPKLRETYEKVMGTSTSSSTRTSDSSTATPPPTTGTGAPDAKSTPIHPDQIGVQSGSAQTPPIPAPVSPSLPNIPLPASPLIAQSNSTLPDLSALQATPTGIPLPASQAQSQQLGKVIQPLPSPASINKAVAPSSQSSPVIRSLYVIAAIIFFVVYTIFWLKILNFQIPFLPF